MTRFWKRHREEPVEALLKSNRPEPRDEFVAAVLERIEPKQRPFHVHGLGRRIVLAAIVTALAVGAAAAAGGINSASNGIGSLVSADKKAVTPPPQANPQGNSNQDDNSPGDNQYAVMVCHHTESATNPWVLITVSPQGAANLVLHHPPDFIVTNPSGCPTRPHP